jgi:hypothetical protein
MIRKKNKRSDHMGASFISSGAQIRTEDLLVMSQNPESVPFVRRVLQISQTDERWFLLARHAAIVDRYA